MIVAKDTECLICGKKLKKGEEAIMLDMPDCYPIRREFVCSKECEQKAINRMNDPDMEFYYDFSNAERGKYFKNYQKGVKVKIIEDDESGEDSEKVE